MQQILDRYASGVLISSVTLQAVQPPEQVQVAFDDAVKAGQDRERQKNEGQAYANDVIPGTASRLLQEAEGYRSMVVENATGNASRFKQVLVEYQKAPGVTRDRMYLGHHAADLLQHQQGDGGCQDRQQPAVPAARQADRPGGSDRCKPPPRAQRAAPAASTTLPSELMPSVEVNRSRDPRSRESLRDRESR
jgi:membrane protease subunit HflK